jgi:UDP-GlcNAc:undecaprenyl-phosphate GlcNAc-1-phosphate transferase
VLSVRATQNPASPVSAALPVLLLALPILDTTSVMAQRISEGRSPFSADKNHIHHKLLALGFNHHEAVTVIYVIQAALFVTAYFLRYESDLLILGVVTAFFVTSITVLQAAARSGCKVRAYGRGAEDAPMSRFVIAIRRAKLLPRLTYLAIAIALTAYASLIVVDTASVSRDIRALLFALLTVVVVILGIRRAAPLSFVDKAAMYVTATALVYLDALVIPSSPAQSVLSCVAVLVAAVATAIRVRLFSDRRFELTPLDLLVLFMALVVPSLPGTLSLPHGGALAIAKLVVVFYALEMLVSRSEDKAIWVRIAVASVLVGLIIRS